MGWGTGVGFGIRGIRWTTGRTYTGIVEGIVDGKWTAPSIVVSELVRPHTVVIALFLKLDINRVQRGQAWIARSTII